MPGHRKTARVTPTIHGLHLAIQSCMVGAGLPLPCGLHPLSSPGEKLGDMPAPFSRHLEHGHMAGAFQLHQFGVGY